MNPADFPAPKHGFVLTHFLVVSDQDRSRNFYRSLFDGQVLLERDPVIMKVANKSKCWARSSSRGFIFSTSSGGSRGPTTPDQK